MKLPQILILIVIAVGIGIFISVSMDVSTYRTFAEAQELAKEGNDTEVHVVGSLIKNKNNEIEGMYYNPQVDPNYFSFTLKDSLNNQMTVVYSNPKPTDFDRSDKVVVIGRVKQDKFWASKVLLKCPSKYNETEIKETTLIRKEETLAIAQ